MKCIQVTNTSILFDEGNRKYKRYVYDHVIDEYASQELTYEKTTLPLVKDVLNGYTAAVFAYGATGSGNFQSSRFLTSNKIDFP